MLWSGDVGRLRSVATQVRIIPTSIYNTKPIVLFRVTRYTIELTEARSTPTLTEIERATKKKNSELFFYFPFLLVASPTTIALGCCFPFMSCASFISGIVLLLFRLHSRISFSEWISISDPIFRFGPLLACGFCRSQSTSYFSVYGQMLSAYAHDT